VELSFKFDTKRCLHTTQVFKLKKGVEHLYYFSLLTGTEQYRTQIAGGIRVGRTVASVERLWLSWVKMGFDTSLVEGPPEVARADWVRTETSPQARHTEIRAEAFNDDALRNVEKILKRAEAVRSQVEGKTPGERKTALAGDPEFQALLLNPLGSVLEQISLREDESARLVEAAQDCLVWVTDHDIVGFSSSASQASPAPALIGTFA